MTGADVLRTDYELEPSGIYTALKNMEVEIRWDEEAREKFWR